MPYYINSIDEVSGRWHLCSLLRSRFLNFLAFYQNRNLSFYCNRQWRFKHIIGSQDSIIGVTHIFLSFSDILIGCWTFLSLYFLYNFYVLLLLFLSSPVYKLFKLTFGLCLYQQKINLSRLQLGIRFNWGIEWNPDLRGDGCGSSWSCPPHSTGGHLQEDLMTLDLGL